MEYIPFYNILTGGDDTALETARWATSQFPENYTIVEICSLANVNFSTRLAR